MPRRIDIELTSALGDGSWTWRAAGAKQPKGVLDGSILPSGAAIGDELKVEIEQEIDGITVLNVVQGRDKPARDDVIELLPVEREFQPVVETRARRERGERRPRRDGDRRPRRDDRDSAGRDGRRSERGDRGDTRGGGADRGGEADGGGERRRDRRRDRRGPSFTPPPEVPQRPKPKRLKPGKAHRSTILNELPEEQRAIAELALQGMGAVRSRLKEENQRAVAEGRPPMPEATVLKMAEELLPRLRVAEWLDRAEAAQRQLEHLDLRDLRSVVATAGDPMVARDESTRALAVELQGALASKQEQELHLWFADVDAALAVGRVIRALRLSSQPPKAGVPFPSDIAQRLIDSTNAALAPMDGPDRWSAILEAAAFSPVRTMIRPARKPDVVSDELAAVVRRLAPALPLVAELFEIEVPADAPMPKPQRPGPRQRKGKDDPPRQRERPGPKAGAKQKQTPKVERSETESTADADADTAPATEPAADAAANAAPATEPAADTDADAAPATEPAADTAADATPDEPAAERAADAAPDAAPATESTLDADAPRPAADATPDEPAADTTGREESSAP